MYQVILIIHVAISAGLVMFVLLQQGKGGGMGGLGGGASTTLFGSSGSADFMSRTTAILATGFFITSLTLSIIAVNQVKAQHAQDLPKVTATQNSEVPVETKAAAPAAPVVPVTAAPTPAAPAAPAEPIIPAQ